MPCQHHRLAPATLPAPLCFLLQVSHSGPMSSHTHTLKPAAQLAFPLSLALWLQGSHTSLSEPISLPTKKGVSTGVDKSCQLQVHFQVISDFTSLVEPARKHQLRLDSSSGYLSTTCPWKAATTPSRRL